MSNPRTGIRTHLQQLFSWLSFKEDTHQYFDEEGNELRSTTSFIEQFKHPFKKDEVAQRIAKRDGLNRGDIIADWEKKGALARALGTRVHLYAEHYPQLSIPSCGREAAVLKWYTDNIPGRFRFICSELRIGHREAKVAGTIDLVLMDEKTGALVLADWKTNKEIKNKAYDNLKAPFENWPQNSFTTYSIQLNTYANIIETTTGFRVQDKIILHIPEGAKEAIEYKVEEGLNTSSFFSG